MYFKYENTYDLCRKLKKKNIPINFLSRHIFSKLHILLFFKIGLTRSERMGLTMQVRPTNYSVNIFY